MIFLGMAAEAEEMVFIHLTLNGQYVVDHYEEGNRTQRTLPMNKDRLLRRYGLCFDLSGICFDITLN